MITLYHFSLQGLKKLAIKKQSEAKKFLQKKIEKWYAVLYFFLLIETVLLNNNEN